MAGPLNDIAAAAGAKVAKFDAEDVDSGADELFLSLKLGGTAVPRYVVLKGGKNLGFCGADKAKLKELVASASS